MVEEPSWHEAYRRGLEWVRSAVPDPELRARGWTGPSNTAILFDHDDDPLLTRARFLLYRADNGTNQRKYAKHYQDIGSRHRIVHVEQDIYRLDFDHDVPEDVGLQGGAE